MSEDVAGVDEGLLLGRVEGSEETGDVLVKVIGVGAVEEDRVGEPGFVKVPGALYGDGVGGRVGEWDFVATIRFERDGE